MNSELLFKLKQKKTKKEKIIIVSYINNILLAVYNNLDIDFIRFDIDEFSKLFGYKDKNRIYDSDIFALLKNIKNAASESDNLKPVAVDVPLSVIYSHNDYSLEKIINFYNKSNADILAFDIDYNILDIAKNLTNLNIPVVIYSTNQNINDEKSYNQKIYNKLVETESTGALMLILENYPSAFVQKLKIQ